MNKSVAKPNTQVVDALYQAFRQLVQRLPQDYGSGFSHSGLTRIVMFLDPLPEEAIVAALSHQLSWSHYVQLIKLDDPTQRSFYIDLCTQSHRRLPARHRPHPRNNHGRR